MQDAWTSLALHVAAVMPPAQLETIVAHPLGMLAWMHVAPNVHAQRTFASVPVSLACASLPASVVPAASAPAASIEGTASGVLAASRALASWSASIPTLASFTVLSGEQATNASANMPHRIMRRM